MQTDLLVQLVTDIHSTDDDRIVEAAKHLLALTEFGSPAGVYLLAGGKAALRKGRISDAVVLLYRAIKVSEPGTLVWGEIMVNRAVACLRHGYYPDAIDAGTTFLTALPTLPSEAYRWAPVAHHAVGQAADRMGDFHKAAYHHQMAADGYSDPLWKMKSVCNWAYSLALGGDPDAGENVLRQLNLENAPEVLRFGYFANLCIVEYHQKRYSDAVSSGDRAEEIARGHEDEWAAPLAEFRYWLSKAAWETGNRVQAARLAMYAAVIADVNWNVQLCELATQLLAEMMDKGGLR